jgi:hypothetical protein
MTATEARPGADSGATADGHPSAGTAAPASVAEPDTLDAT